MLRLLGWLGVWPRKHRYRCVGRDDTDGAAVTHYQCAGCGDYRMQDRWYSRTMPWDMAQCPRGRPLALHEVLSLLLSREYATFDCYEPPVASDRVLN